MVPARPILAVCMAVSLLLAGLAGALAGQPCAHHMDVAADLPDCHDMDMAGPAEPPDTDTGLCCDSCACAAATGQTGLSAATLTLLAVGPAGLQAAKPAVWPSAPPGAHEHPPKG